MDTTNLLFNKQEEKFEFPRRKWIVSATKADSIIIFIPAAWGAPNPLL